jgi:transposase
LVRHAVCAPEVSLARPPTEPLRPLTPEERTLLEEIAHSRSERADRVARARALLALAAGATFTAAAARAGFRSARGVVKLVRRFHQEGLPAVAGRHGGGHAIQYGPAEQERILREFRRTPDRAQDGTATWSLSTLQRFLRQAPDGLPAVSTFTIFQTLHRAGYSCQKNRTWCQTGTALRKRKRPDGTPAVVKVSDPQADEKRGTSSKATP